jgi:uncharacterized protein DUF6928
VGAKTALLVYTDGEPVELLRGAPEPDPEATTMLVDRTNPGWDRTAHRRRDGAHRRQPRLAARPGRPLAAPA